jgi:hypothetical protein
MEPIGESLAIVGVGYPSMIFLWMKTKMMIMGMQNKRILIKENIMTNEIIERPEFVTDEHLVYLDELRESGETNMFGARPYLMEEFDELSKTEAEVVLTYWMKTFSERHPEEN